MLGSLVVMVVGVGQQRSDTIVCEGGEIALCGVRTNVGEVNWVALRWRGLIGVGTGRPAGILKGGVGIEGGALDEDSGVVFLRP